MLKQAVNINEVSKGMEVFDSTGQRIGSVIASRQGEGTIKTNKTDNSVIVQTIKDVIGDKKSLPAPLYTRLFDEGFVYVARGFLRSNGIIYPEQIASINGNKITLHVGNQSIQKI
jgi:hypothetical protein